jgi:hypothetical protein
MTFNLEYMVEILKNMENDAENNIIRDYLQDFEKLQKELENFKNSMKE